MALPCRENRFSILIAARNAGATIERAVRSCLTDRYPIILVDDQCSDNTVDRAHRLTGGQLQVIRTVAPGGVSVARQNALDAVTTQYAAWLDADDIWLPGRAPRLLALLEAGADIAADPIELFDGPSGTYLRTLDIPEFIRSDPHPLRLFERNYLPGDTQVAFRTDVFREAGGYDAAIVGPESFDLLLRALMQGARFAYCAQPGYRMFAYPDSVSRDLARQRAATRDVLRKHAYEDVAAACRKHGYPSSAIAWLLVSMALFRDDPQAALRFLDTVGLPAADAPQILEPDGPCPLPEAWRHAFFAGTAHLLLGGADAKAVRGLRQAEEVAATAEGRNNLGVALRRLGDEAGAGQCFARAIELFADYADARANRASGTMQSITTHPLRRQASRHEYLGAH